MGLTGICEGPREQDQEKGQWGGIPEPQSPRRGWMPTSWTSTLRATHSTPTPDIPAPAQSSSGAAQAKPGEAALRERVEGGWGARVETPFPRCCRERGLGGKVQRAEAGGGLRVPKPSPKEAGPVAQATEAGWGSAAGSDPNYSNPVAPRTLQRHCRCACSSLTAPRPDRPPPAFSLLPQTAPIPAALFLPEPEQTEPGSSP